MGGPARRDGTAPALQWASWKRFAERTGTLSPKSRPCAGKLPNARMRTAARCHRPQGEALPSQHNGRGRRAATMRDVATAAGVGLATVSRVVNGQSVTPDLAERVTRAAESLGYRLDV